MYYSPHTYLELGRAHEAELLVEAKRARLAGLAREDRERPRRLARALSLVGGLTFRRRVERPAASATA